LDLTLKAQSLATCPLWVIRYREATPPMRSLRLAANPRRAGSFWLTGGISWFQGDL